MSPSLTKAGNFNPRTPRGVRLKPHPLQYLYNHISIHAPREGCDVLFSGSNSSFILNFNPRTPRGVRQNVPYQEVLQQKFQSTHPARGATRRRRAPREEEGISIHAPREGCDGRLWYTIDVVEGFQSTHPARGATISMYGHGGMWIFQSTHPARGATG